MAPGGTGPGPRRRPAARRVFGAGAAAGLAAAVLAGCGASAVRVDGARQAVRVFEAALASHDYAAACAVLAPVTRSQLEQDEKQPCAQALGGQELPVSAAIGTPEVYGRQALVRAGGETLFLSQFTGGWRVVAAGCTPQGEAPYRCLVKGG
ncbi:hypothetical protein [Streptomyces sp. NRRL F-2664]|uniref:hypothetical protein n=1 Tax=Streptomyces sp. NRRL F-2664 TaxID=1463842 RepID=UPI00131ADB58|nr:hypothetical protein [Streptomyces sp. NRRL F-2664]